jgi:hypothetical protein
MIAMRCPKGEQGVSDRPPGLARMPSWADQTPPWPGSWCRACHENTLVDRAARPEEGLPLLVRLIGVAAQPL